MKRIEFLTQDDVLYILPLFAEFFRSYLVDVDIAQVSCCRTMGRRRRLQLLKEVLRLYGLPGFCRVAGRRALAEVLAPWPAKRGASHYWSMRQLCRAYGVPFGRIEDPNTEAYVNGLRERAPDLLVSVACPYILKEPVRSIPTMGCINIHHGPLPRYRGMMPTFWQMLNGEREVGVTVHYITGKIDEGEVLFEGKLRIEPGETLDHLIRRSKQHGAHILGQVIRELGVHHQRAFAACAATGSYFSFPGPEAIREFHRKGLRAI